MQTKMIDKQWSEKYPDLGTGPVSTEPCISPEFFERERELIFRRHWLNLGRVEEIPKAGDYVVHELVVCDLSILIVRGEDDKIRAFHNVCPHRGNTLVLDEHGKCPGRFGCGFHAWAFNPQGELVFVPDEENFFDLDKSQYGLTPIHCDIWEGFIFINLASEPKETLRESLGGVATQLDGAGFEKMRLLKTYKVEEASNWKTALDAQNELYHLPFQHRFTIGDSFLLKDDKYCRFSNVNLYNYHSVWSCEFNPNHIELPTEAVLNRLDRALNNVRMSNRISDFDWYLVFPNMAVLLFAGISGDFFMTYHFWPLSVDRCLWEMRYFFPEAENVGQRLNQEWTIGRLRDTLMEDAFQHEKIQKGLASRARSHMIMQDEEVTIRHFHNVIEREMARV
jgi:phenylpropionate dioxygenase-like ring-hydroxylating dioxygenase large terminal subunit